MRKEMSDFHFIEIVQYSLLTSGRHGTKDPEVGIEV